MFSNRRLLIGTFLVTICLASPSVNAQTWIYDESEGGWKDAQTGLVWFEHPSPGTFAEAQVFAANLVQLGFDDWRLPTVDEMQTALAHGIGDSGIPLHRDDLDPPPRVLWWSSRAQGKKKAYAFDLRHGELARVLQRSWLHVICVRQATVGE